MRVVLPTLHVHERSIQLLSVMTFTIASFALVPKTEAVIPPPDGGYPGFNTAEGTRALQSRTIGVANAVVGWYSLFSNTDGSFNTAIGTGTLFVNTGGQNTATGVGALFSNTSGSQNGHWSFRSLLLNEFFKEHRKVQELEATIARQQKDSEANDAKQRALIQALTARLDGQDAKIQKVTDEIELGKPSSQIASNDQ
jgi:hypothetical protein